MKTLLISFLFLSLNAQAARFVVEGKHKPTTKDLATLAAFKVEPFSSVKDSFFNRSLVVSGKVSKEELLQLSWVKHVEEPVELKRLSIEPSKNPTRLVTDELFAYQWGLLNEGQTYYREIDDIRNLPMVGTTGSDIGWKEMVNIIPKERVIVAVLDSGVDLNHPEIAPNLWKNLNECGKDPAVDNDSNKLPGDCHGWNFTETLDSEDAKSPDDIEGHGTHVAGIIGAAKNGEGIVGVNPNVLIMPVKVIKDIKSNSEVQSSEALARGIIYATDMGASVINLSLGWPRSLETKLLREAVYYALGQGVVIVAAAGNNNSSEPLFPCAYDGVICAGASTLNGDFAGFSNYGGHVDTLAPGEGILSLFPSLYEPELFSVTGYELKSGTSQSAPVVAGLISAVKALDPKITIDELFARLYSAPAKKESSKYVLGGDVTWETISRKVSGPVVRPVLKRVRQLVLGSQRQDARLILPIRNFGLASEMVKVSIESLSPSIEVISPELTIDSIAHAEVKELPFIFRVKDFKGESNIKIKVNLSSAEGDVSFYNEIPVVRDIRGEADLTRLGFAFNKNPLPVGTIKAGAILPLISTMDAQLASDRHEFFMKRNLEVEGKRKIELTIITRIGNKYVEAPKPIIIDNAISIVNFTRVDLDLDGKEDYLVQAVIEEGENKSFLFSFYNSSMEDLWPKFQHAQVVLDTTIRNMNDLSYIAINHSELGKIKVPVFFTQGQLPKVDQVLGRGERLDAGKESRLYFLNPDVKEKKLRIRSFTTNIWKEKVKSTLKAKWFHTVLVEQLLPASADDIRKGVLRVFFSVGDLSKRQLFIGTVNGESIQSSKPIPQIVVQTQDVDSLYAVTSGGLETVGEVYLNVYDRFRARLIMTSGQEQIGNYVYKHDAQTDVIAGHLVSFQKDQGNFSVLQSREELIAVSNENGNVKITKRPKVRYSFLSATTLSEMYNPVIYKRNGLKAPALYVDSTSVTANRINLFEEQDGNLVSSIQNSLTVPSNCKSMNPRFSNASDSHEFVFLCFEEAQKEWVIRTLPMK